MKIFIRLFIAFALLSLLGVFSVAGILYYFSLDLPKISSLADYRPEIPSQILSKDGTVLAEIGVQKRDVVNIDDVPESLINAFLAAEDDNFYNHQGIDYVGIIRAMVKNIKAGRIVQGGSTITQQVAKSLLLTSERKFSRKIKDLLLAWRIEDKFPKRDILHLYLNQVYLGGGYYGVKSAFKGYFEKELEEATVAECAIIAGLLVAPGRYSPYIHPKYAKNRQSYVLGRMLAGGKITQEEYQAAKSEKIKFRVRKTGLFKAGYFTDWVRQRVIALVGEEIFLRDGFRVTTTLDWDLQQVAEKAVYKGAKDTDKRQGYKGHLGHIETDEEIIEHEIEFRKKLYKKKSNYFTLTDDYKKVYEMEYSEDEYNQIVEQQSELADEINNKYFIPGNIKDDPFLNIIKEDETYKAVVTSVSNAKRMIYISIGGIKGIIPYEKFRWARERSITEERNFTPSITRPSSILKRGDKILVSVEKLSVGQWKYFYKSYVAKLKGNKKIKEKLKEIKKERFLLCSLEQEPEVQTALLSIAPQTGEIKAFVGGTDFRKSQFDRIIQSRRQPGSSFKPFIYAAALENGFTPASILIDSPEALLGGIDTTLNWKPRNYNGKFMGELTLRKSLQDSKNVTTIKLAHEVGVRKIISFTDRICFNAKIDQDLGLALGSFGVSMLDLVSSYAIFPNRGRIVEPKSIISIVDRDGNSYELLENSKMKSIEDKVEEERILALEKELIDQERVEEEGLVVEKEVKKEEEKNIFQDTLGGAQVYDPRLAYLMTNLLKGVVKYGTGRQTRSISNFIGGKTGTTNSYVDAWFVGFSHNLATAVWTGFDNNNTLGWGETGAKASLPVWRTFMKAGLEKYGEHDFFTPKGIINVKIDKKTGKLYRGGTDKLFIESFVEGTEPGSEKDDNYGSLGGDKDSKDSILSEDDYYNFQ